MTYDEYKAMYNKYLKAMLSYTCEQIGSGHYAEKLGKLHDENVAHAERFDAIES